MGKEYPARSFKSGNSVAIRIPAALGVEPDREWLAARDDNGDLVIRARIRADKMDLSEVYGRGAGLKPLSPEERILEGRDLDWTGERLKRGD